MKTKKKIEFLASPGQLDIWSALTPESKIEDIEPEPDHDPEPKSINDLDGPVSKATL